MESLSEEVVVAAERLVLEAALGAVVATAVPRAGGGRERERPRDLEPGPFDLPDVLLG